jgi:uncharacterized membrane protein
VGLDRSELARGWRETRQYLLSHHEPATWHRCYAPEIRGRRVRLCARCLGIYPGILVGLFAVLRIGLPISHYYLVALLPLPALVDWTVTTFTDRIGSNPVRTLTGFLLGIGYAIGLVRVVGNADPGVLVVGSVYALAAGLLLVRAKSRPSPSQSL